MVEIDEIFKELSPNSTYVIEKRSGLKKYSVMIIKDEFTKLNQCELDKIEVGVQGAIVKRRNIKILCIFIKIYSNEYSKIYSFFFDYKSKESLKLLSNMLFQRSLSIVLIPNNQETILKKVIMKNSIKSMIKEYIHQCGINSYGWSSDDYNKLLKATFKNYEDIKNTWSFIENTNRNRII